MTTAVITPPITAWTLERGARLLDDGRTRFSVWAPHARRCELVLESGDERTVHEMAA